MEWFKEVWQRKEARKDAEEGAKNNASDVMAV
jgi:hypothetical protein